MLTYKSSSVGLLIIFLFVVFSRLWAWIILALFLHWVQMLLMCRHLLMMLEHYHFSLLLIFVGGGGTSCTLKLWRALNLSWNIVVLFIRDGTLPCADIILPLVQSRVLLLEYVQQSLTGFQYLHECLFCLLYGPIKLLLCLVLLYQCLSQHLKPLCQWCDLSLDSILFFFIFSDLIMQVVTSLPDILNVAGELLVVPLEGTALGEL